MFLLSANNLKQSNVSHGFFGRTGGVSTGLFASLNCGPGSGDARHNVIENRRRALSCLSPKPNAQLLTLHQIHSGEAVIVSGSWELGQGPHADAMATNIPGLALGILTADCAPVLFADSEVCVVGAAHAGWKGALGGVIESALRAMERLGASRTRVAAAIGPCIGQVNYEVGPELAAKFRDADPDNAQFFVPSDKPDHWRFDLHAYVTEQLAAAGIANVETIGGCTYAYEADFFSFRRATHRGEVDYGRQVSAILLKS